VITASGLTHNISAAHVVPYRSLDFHKELPDAALLSLYRPELKAAWERGKHDRFYPYGKTYGQVFREQE